MRNFKIHIPNILTSSRIVISILIMIAGLTGNYFLLAGLITTSGITDFLDGKIARKYNTTDNPNVILNGKNLDAISDKIFGFSTIISLAPISILSLTLIPIELIISIINIKKEKISENKDLTFKSRIKKVFLNKYKDTDKEKIKPKSSLIGKIKTASLIVNLVSIAILPLIPELITIIEALTALTLSLQGIASVNYLKEYLKVKKELTNSDIASKIDYHDLDDNQKDYNKENEFNKSYVIENNYTKENNNDKPKVYVYKKSSKN